MPDTKDDAKREHFDKDGLIIHKARGGGAVVRAVANIGRAKVFCEENPVVYEIVVEELRRGTPQKQIINAHPETNLDLLQAIRAREGIECYKDRIQSQFRENLQRVLDSIGSMSDEELAKVSLKDRAVVVGIFSDKSPSLLEPRPAQVVEHRVLTINLSATLDELRKGPPIVAPAIKTSVIDADTTESTTNEPKNP